MKTGDMISALKTVFPTVQENFHFWQGRLDAGSRVYWHFAKTVLNQGRHQFRQFEISCKNCSTTEKTEEEEEEQ